MRCLARVKAEQIILPERRLFGKFIHLRTNGQVDTIDMVELVRVGMDMHKNLIRMIGRDQRIAVGRCLTEPRADREHQIGKADNVIERCAHVVAQMRQE